VSEHTCHAIGCDTPVPPRLFMCRKHWRMVPEDMQARIWATYRRGQEVDKQPSRAYLDATHDARLHVAQLEGRRPSTGGGADQGRLW